MVLVLEQDRQDGIGRLHVKDTDCSTSLPVMPRRQLPGIGDCIWIWVWIRVGVCQRHRADFRRRKNDRIGR
jgi:hypothetical protein